MSSQKYPQTPFEVAARFKAQNLDNTENEGNKAEVFVGDVHADAKTLYLETDKIK